MAATRLETKTPITLEEYDSELKRITTEQDEKYKPLSTMAHCRVMRRSNDLSNPESPCVVVDSEGVEANFVVVLVFEVACCFQPRLAPQSSAEISCGSTARPESTQNSAI